MPAGGQVEGFSSKSSWIFGLFGAEWEAINWLNDPRGLFQLIVEGVTNGAVTIPSRQWYLRGTSITWMAIMAQNIFGMFV